ncbi:MurR/RpiR family transcriptional regulator [Sinomonas gamaensis]|jgi:DNA-binding MurR/RpiR family transcriptional regulator|uniref:MurR/RpiR family transcriptional regulator n=1 Tax=Sinomonas gamaensis TaxID=2565624 RepID=UPI00110833B4|nr:MurR/RpiR family transcriptional regulator [Sinomonas gamaensis]
MIRIKKEIFDRMEELSPSERKVARALLADYPSSGLGSAGQLARAAGTSAPTVLRLVARLGLGSYADFQKHLRDEIMHDLKAPVHRAESEVPREERTDVGRSLAERRDLIDRLGSTVSGSEIERAAQLLASEPKAVLISGGYYSRFLAEILARQLDQIIPNVDFLPDPLGYNVGKFYGARRNTVVVLFDLRRYQLQAAQVAALAKREGASLVVITDEELSPIADKADVVLAVPVGGIPFDSFAALMVLVEVLVEAVLRAAGQRGIDRMKLWEDRSYLERTPHPEPEEPASPSQEAS